MVEEATPVTAYQASQAPSVSSASTHAIPVPARMEPHARPFHPLATTVYASSASPAPTATWRSTSAAPIHAVMVVYASRKVSVTHVPVWMVGQAPTVTSS